MGEVGAGRRAVPVLLTLGDQDRVAFGHLYPLGPGGDQSRALRYEEYLVAGVSVELVAGTGGEADKAEVEVLSVAEGPKSGCRVTVPPSNRGALVASSVGAVPFLMTFISPPS